MHACSLMLSKTIITAIMYGNITFSDMINETAEGMIEKGKLRKKKLYFISMICI